MLELVLEGPMNLRVATILDTLHENLASGLWEGRLTFNKEQRLSKVVVMMILTTVIMQMILTKTKIMMMMTMMMNIHDTDSDKDYDMMIHMMTTMMTRMTGWPFHLLHT